MIVTAAAAAGGVGWFGRYRGESHASNRLPSGRLVLWRTLRSYPGPLKGDPDKKQPNADRLKGMKAAIADIEAGKLKQKSGALPDPAWHRRYVELLNEECGVEWETIEQTTAKR